MEASDLDFSNLGTGDVTDVEGTATLSITDFVSITGSFGFQKFSDNGATYLAVGASDLTIVLGTDYDQRHAQRCQLWNGDQTRHRARPNDICPAGECGQCDLNGRAQSATCLAATFLSGFDEA